MATKNFVAKNGLTVGNLTIDANSGSLITTGNITTSSSVVTTKGIFWANGKAFSSSTTRVGNTSPTGATVGDFWYNTTNDRMYEFISNGTYSFWLDFTGPTVKYLNTPPTL